MIVLVLLALGVAPVRAEEEGERCTVFVETLDAALTEAAKTDRLVYAHLGAGEEGPPGIEGEVLTALAERYVVLVLSGCVDDPESNAFRVRYGLDPLGPAEVALTPAGLLVAKGLAFTLPHALEDMEDAAKAARVYSERAATLAMTPTTEARRELAHLHGSAGNLAAAIPLLRQLTQEDPKADDCANLVSVLRRKGERQEAGLVLRTMIDRWPEEPRRIEWRIQLATIDLDPIQVALAEDGRHPDDGVIARGATALYELIDEVHAEGRLADEAEVRMRLAKGFARNSVECLLHHEWIVTHDPTGRHGAESRLVMIQFALYQGDFAQALTHCEAFLLDFPLHGNVSFIRDERIPQLRARLVPGNPEVKWPIRVEAKWDSHPLRQGSPVHLVATVHNRSKERVRDVTVKYVAHGNYEATTDAEARVRLLEPGQSLSIAFGLVPKEPGPIFAIVQTWRGGGMQVQWVRVSADVE